MLNQQQQHQSADDFISWKYRYVRAFTASSNIVANPQYKKLIDNVQSIAIVAIGIPDGLSLLQWSTATQSMRNRLNVFSQETLSEKFLQTIDESYGDEVYPVMRLVSPVAIIDGTFSSREQRELLKLPLDNFYTIVGKTIPPADGSSSSYAGVSGGEFVEYRYLQQRQFYPTLAWDPSTGYLYKFVMPNKKIRNRPIKCLIMPENFVRTDVNTGYWNFDGLIFHVFARNCTLVGGRYESEDLPYITSISNEDPRTISIITSFLSKIGMHKIESTAVNQVYAIDRYLTVVVGSLNNLAL